MIWALFVLVYAGLIFAMSWILSYNAVRDGQRPAVRQRMPRGSVAFFRWVTRVRPKGTD
jgi:uncharacterized membrane protein